MEKKRMGIGILLVAGSLIVMTVVVVMFYPAEQKENSTKQSPSEREETQRLDDKEAGPPVQSVAGKCFESVEERFFFYTDKYVVITATGRDEFGGTFAQRNWYAYRIEDGLLNLKNREDSFSCPFSWEDGGIVIDGARYTVKKMTVHGENDLIWHTYERGGQKCHFISEDTVVVSLDGETEAWGYSIQGNSITFTYGTGGAEDTCAFAVTDKGILIDKELYKRQ